MLSRIFDRNGSVSDLKVVALVKTDVFVTQFARKCKVYLGECRLDEFILTDVVFKHISMDTYMYLSA